MDDVPPDFFGWLFGRRGGPPAGAPVRHDREYAQRAGAIGNRRHIFRKGGKHG